MTITDGCTRAARMFKLALLGGSLLTTPALAADPPGTAWTGAISKT